MLSFQYQHKEMTQNDTKKDVLRFSSQQSREHAGLLISNNDTTFRSSIPVTEFVTASILRGTVIVENEGKMKNCDEQLITLQMWRILII